MEEHVILVFAKGKQKGGVEVIPEIFNSVGFADLHPRYLEVQNVTIIILMRNLDALGGACNGTCLLVTEFHDSTHRGIYYFQMVSNFFVVWTEIQT